MDKRKLFEGRDDIDWCALAQWVVILACVVYGAPIAYRAIVATIAVF